MGWYLRKSLSFGPLRLNLSRSGLGGSVGVKGLRVGTGPRGRYLHAGRDGLYYRSSLDKPPKASPEVEAAEAAEAPASPPADGLTEAKTKPGRNQLGMRLLRAVFGGLTGRG